MISEAIGKILGMAMAYGVSALGLFLAYANYRKRVVKAERVMSGAAWGVVGATALAILLAVVVVIRLASAEASAAAATATEPATEAVAPEPAASVAPQAVPAVVPDRGDRWPVAGMLLPAAIFLFATWVTSALYRHFSHEVHAPAPPGGGQASTE